MACHSASLIPSGILGQKISNLRAIAHTPIGDEWDEFNDKSVLFPKIQVPVPENESIALLNE